MKVFVLTEDGCGMASRCLPALLTAKNVEVANVILVDPAPRRKVRILKKVFKIGILGAINGVRMRAWYSDQEHPLEVVCRQFGIPFICGVRQNSVELQKIVVEMNADLGLSLGNGFISSKIFSLPRFGMLNVHSEILPRYQNAQSIIWPIYFNDPYTGFSIHEIERKIDGGRILYQRRVPIRFYESLEQTVRENRRIVESMIPLALAEVCRNFDRYKANAIVQLNGSTYTTPSIWSYFRMVRNNRKFYAQQH